MTDKDKSKEKKSSALEDTLLREDFMQTVASNLIKSKPNEYGSKGLDAANSVYDQVMNSENMSAYRNQLNGKKQELYRSQGVAGEPSAMSNGDLSYEVMKQIDSVMSMSKLGELYSVIKKAVPGLDIKIPKGIENMTQNQLIEIASKKKALTEKGLDATKLSKEEQVAFAMYETLSSAYKELGAANLISNAIYQEFNEKGKILSDELKPKEEKPKE